MSGTRMELCKKALLLFLQSLNEDCLFQLIGFGSDFEYYTKEPVEYNKESIQNLMNLIKNLNANKGGTKLYSPLKDIYNNNIYEKYDMIKHIFLLTDGEIREKESTLNLIGNHSNDFYFHSLGIGDCDKDLIERSALVGNGYSYYINNLDDLNKIIISALDKSQSEIKIECGCEQKDIIEEQKRKYIKLNDYFRHGVISDKTINDINFKIKYMEKEEKIELKDFEIKKLPDGEELGKLIVDNYLKENKSLNFRTKIKLSKDYNILCSETAFYAEIQNEVPVTKKMSVITNKNKEAINNNIMQEINLRNIGYENKANYFNINNNEIKENKKSFFERIFSIFSCKKSNNEIIKKKSYKFNEEPNNNISSNSSSQYNKRAKRKLSRERHKYRHNNKERALYDCFFEKNITESLENICVDEKKCFNYNMESKVHILKDVDEINDNKKKLNFDEIILNQDIIEGNWKRDSQIELLIEKEKDIFEKINKYSEKKGIKDENGIITLFILNYIFKKKSKKVEELKFVIDKAKNYIKKIYNLEYDEIIKELII